MSAESLVATYEGDGIIRLHQVPRLLRKDQEVLVMLMPLPDGREVEQDTRVSPLMYFRRIVERLARYERKYGMTSETFYRRFERGEIEEGPFDYFDWRALYDGYRLMKERFGFSREQAVGV